MNWERNEKYENMLKDVKSVDDIKVVMEAVMSENERLHDRMIQIEDLLARIKELVEKFNGK